MSAPVLLGIDGGGTATTAWLADAQSNVVGCGRAGPSNQKAVGPQRARQAVSAAIAAAFADMGAAPGPVDIACLGLAGFDRPEDQALLHEWSDALGWAKRLLLVNDGALVIAAGTPDGWGLGLIAGTGSIAVGRAPDGRTARAGGWGHLIGDEGSAYAVALAGLRWVARRADGRMEPDIGHDLLTERLCHALAIADPSALVSTIYSSEFDRTRIAGLAPAVLDAAKDDVRIEQAILEPAAHELAEMVLAVARALGWPREPAVARWPLALAGSFLLSAEPVARAFLLALDAQRLRVSCARVEQPVRGAIVLARRALEG